MIEMHAPEDVLYSRAVHIPHDGGHDYLPCAPSRFHMMEVRVTRAPSFYYKNSYNYHNQKKL